MRTSNTEGTTIYAWETIEQSLVSIKEHLTEGIYTEELANVADLSPFYFQRLFKWPINKPVQEYVKLRRPVRVTEDVGNTRQRILDAALDYDLTSHANFTQAFKGTYGIIPEEYGRDLPMLSIFGRSGVSMNYVLVDEGVPLVVGNIVLEIQRKTLAKPGAYLGLETEVRISEQIPVGEGIGVGVSGQLQKCYYIEKTSIAANTDISVEMGMSHTRDTVQDLFTYFASGLIQDIPRHQQECFVKRKFAVRDYIVCRIGTENLEDLVTDALNQGGKYLFGTWLPHHNLAAKPSSAGKYYRDLKDMACMEIRAKPLPLRNKKQEGGMDRNMFYTAGNLYTGRLD